MRRYDRQVECRECDNLNPPGTRKCSCGALLGPAGGSGASCDACPVTDGLRPLGGVLLCPAHYDARLPSENKPALLLQLEATMAAIEELEFGPQPNEPISEYIQRVKRSGITSTELIARADQARRGVPGAR